MRKTNKPIEGYEEGCGEAEEVLGESQKSCTVLASEFGDFTRECGAQIWAMKSQVETTLTTEQSTGITCPEDLICWDVLNICSAIANASEPSDEVTAILGAILAKVNPNKFKAEAMSDPATEGVLSRFLAEWVGQGVSIPIVVNIMVVHDRIHGGQGARRAASVYSLLVLQLFSSYMPSLLDRPSVATAAGQVANEYLKLLKVYIERSKTGDHSTQSDTENACEHSNISRDACSECSDAYDLLELPFGASKEDVSDAKRELAKTLHPDVWLDRRGSRFAEERLKHVNAACDHLLECHFSGEQGYGIQEDSIRTTSHTTTADTSVETRGTTEYVPEMGEPLSGSTFWFWRSIRVFLRAVWRFTKIVLAILLGVVAAAIVLLTIFMALWEHWERESKGQRGQSDLGSMNTKLFSFLESVTWIPRQIWGGLMLVATILFFGLVFAGQSIMEFASSNRTACTLLVCLFGLGVMAWVFQNEWQAEFAPSPDQQAPTTSSTVMGLIVVIASIAGSGWWVLNHQAASPEQVGSATSTSAAPTAHVNSEPTASSPGNGDRQLLWDYTSNEQIPELPEEMKQKLRELIGPVTHHEDDMSFGPELIGAFYSGQPPDSQKVYSVTLPWIDIEGRSHAEGDLSFIVVATGDQLDVYEGQYAGKILSVVRPQGAGADLMLIEYEWSGQGEDQKYLRILSVADHSLKLVTDVGMGLIDDYATAQPLREVADRIYYRAETDGSITILPREHFLLQDGPPKDLGMDSDNADEAFGRLLDRAKLDPKPTDAPLTSPSMATTSASATDALQKFDVVQAIRKSCENGFADSCANLARLHDAGGLANQPAAPATESATDDSVTQPTVLVPAISPAGAVMVQVAAVASHDVADILTSSLRKKGYTVAVRHEPQDNLLHVQIGPFADRKDAEAMRQRVLADGFNATVK